MTRKKKEPTDRLVMIWPASFKEEVKAKAGRRGMTGFVTQAVRVYMGQAPSPPTRNFVKEFDQTKYLVQLLADCVAMGGDDLDRKRNLEEIGLPSWVSTVGWPPELAAVVEKPALPEPEEEEEPEPPAPRPDVITSVAVAEREPLPPIVDPPVAVAPTVAPNVHQAAPELGVDDVPAAGDDFFSRIQQHAQSKGLDLKPATAVRTPEVDGRGTSTDPVVIEPPEDGSKVLLYLDHAHTPQGECLKNRYGACEVSTPVETAAPEPDPEPEPEPEQTRFAVDDTDVGF